MIKARTAKFQIGQIVRHRVFSFRGVIFDIDPEFNNTEEWWLSIPEEVRPHKDQPFYHLLAENSESEYVAYVSEQNLLPDDSGEPIRHSQVAEIFVKDKSGRLPPAQSVARTSNLLTATKKAPCSGAFVFCRPTRAFTSRPDWPPTPAAPRASCAALQRASAALPAASSGFPRTPSDRSADRHRPWRIRRPSGSGSVSGAPLELIA